MISHLSLVVLVLLQTAFVNVKGNCKFGREDSSVERTVASQGLQYVDLQHPLTCSGSIVAWHFCYYTDNIEQSTPTSYLVHLRVYRNDTSSQLQRIHDESVAVQLSLTQVGSNTFMCASDYLAETNYLNVSMGDYLAAHISTGDNPLQIVGRDMPQSLLHRDSRNFSLSFTSPIVPFAKLQVLEGGILHLHADVVSPEPTLNLQPTSSMSFMSIPGETQQPTIEGREQGDGLSTNNTDSGINNNGISPSGIAAIASIASILVVLAVLIIALALGIVIYRRWKVNQVKKALLQMHPAHLAIDNATYDLPMLGQDYRLFKTVKKGKGTKGSTGRLSNTSDNVYESPYDEGIAEVFGIYATLKPASVEFRTSLRKVVSTLNKTKPIPYQSPASHEEQIYEQISGQRVPSLSAKQIQTVGHLGSGQFANVEKAVWSRRHGIIEVAVKTLHSDASPADKLKFLQEGAMTSQFRHPNVIFLYGIIANKNKISLVMEYVSKGDLKGRLLDIKANPENIDMPQLLLSYSNQVALGMLYLSDKGFVHRDLAARNILVSEQEICKIADFGMSRDLADAEYYISEGGTIPIRWTAPEAVYYRKYSTASDVWSYGCLLYEIWSLGHKPFESCSNTQVLKEISIGFRLPPPPGCPQRIYEIMIKCWHPHHAKRPDFEDVLSSLLDDEQTVLDVPSEDASTHEQASHLGAELQAGHKMYCQLQAVYISNSALISDQPPCTVDIANPSEDHYQTIDKDTDVHSYLNVHRDLEKSAEHDREYYNCQRYNNIGSVRQADVEEVIYDKVTHNANGTEEKSTATRKEEYYNVVSVDTPEDVTYGDVSHTQHGSLHLSPTSKKGDYYNVVAVDTPQDVTYSDVSHPQHNSLVLPPKASKAPVPGPKPPRNVKRMSGGKKLDEMAERLSDYYESNDSTLTINNDQVVV